MTGGATGGPGGAAGGVRELRTLGPASEELLGRVGIRTVEDLERVGAAEAYRRLRAAGTPGLTRTMLWALAGALLDLDWRDLPAQVKGELLRDVERP